METVTIFERNPRNLLHPSVNNYSLGNNELTINTYCVLEYVLTLYLILYEYLKSLMLDSIFLNNILKLFESDYQD